MSELAVSPYRVGRRIWPLLVGPVVWSLHLVVSYFGGAVMCDTRNDLGWFGRSSAGHGFIVVSTVVAAVLLAATVAWSLKRRSSAMELDDLEPSREEMVHADSFVDALAIGVNLFSLAAVILEGVWAVMSRC